MRPSASPGLFDDIHFNTSSGSGGIHLAVPQFRSPLAPYPLTTPIGSILATFMASPAPSTVLTTWETSL